MERVSHLCKGNISQTSYEHWVIQVSSGFVEHLDQKEACYNWRFLISTQTLAVLFIVLYLFLVSCPLQFQYRNTRGSRNGSIRLPLVCKFGYEWLGRGPTLTGPSGPSSHSYLSLLAALYFHFCCLLCFHIETAVDTKQERDIKQ
jgi:hypothetical protein